jgi:hypothetical protein
MATYIPQVLANEIWFYISTHYFGQKYIAERTGITVKNLKERVYDWNGILESIDFPMSMSGSRLEVSIADEVYAEPSTAFCNGSFRHIRQRMPIKGLINFLSDLTEGGDINCDDFFCLEYIEERYFIYIHRQSTHVIEVHPDWFAFDDIENILVDSGLNFQGINILSNASRSIFSYLIKKFSLKDTPQEYYKKIDELNSHSFAFEYQYRFVINKHKEDPHYFMCY